MLYFSAKPGDRIHLGRRGENLARTIQFDISQWLEVYGPGRVDLLACRGGDAEPYPCVIHVNGNIVDWPITAADTSICSNCGRYELIYTAGDITIKSAVGTTRVDSALSDPSEKPPDVCKSWVDDVLDAAAEVKEATARNPIIKDNHWYVWDPVNGEYVDTNCPVSGDVPDDKIQESVNAYLEEHPPETGVDFTT